MIYQGTNVVDLIPTIGMYAAIAFRIMPSVSRILYSAQQAKYNRPSVEIVSNEISLVKDTNIANSDTSLFSFNKEISLNDVSFRYEGSDQKVLNNVNAIIPKGLLVGFVGSSGSGKSTLMDVLLGMISPDTGSVTIDGVDIESNINGWQKNIGYVPQTVYLTDSTIKSNIAFGIDESSIDNHLMRNAIKSAQLEDFIKSLPDGIESLVGERGVKLSGGQRQRIGIARALYNNPEVVVLDEASSALDIATEGRFLETIKSLSGYKTIIFVTHRESVMNFCDQVYIQKNQKLTKMKM
jgi:ABC-type multidrug transport system fused ATPase/permease subunit